MSRRLQDHGERAPTNRLRDGAVEAAFFPGEVARLLGLPNIDYSQLRRMFVLARVLRGDPRPDRAWARFTLADLAATEVIVGLAGGRDRLALGSRLTFGDLEPTCKALRSMGFENPLLQVPLARVGRKTLAKVDEYIFEPISGQMVLDQTGRLIDQFLEARIIEDGRVRAAIRAERRQLRPARASRLPASKEGVPFQGLSNFG
jgi:hypothetical protein